MLAFELRVAMPLRRLTCSRAADGAGGRQVHCAGGVSRSSAIVAAYLMRAKSMSLADALQLIRNCHPAAAPNSGEPPPRATVAPLLCRRGSLLRRRGTLLRRRGTLFRRGTLLRRRGSLLRRRGSLLRHRGSLLRCWGHWCAAAVTGAPPRVTGAPPRFTIAPAMMRARLSGDGGASWFRPSADRVIPCGTGLTRVGEPLVM